MTATDPDPQLTPLQLAVMRVLWARGAASATRVQAELEPERSLAPTTVATLLRRLEKRGLVEHESVGRQFVYRARVHEAQAREAMVDELKERLFEGDAAELVHHLIVRGALEPGDLARVRRLIEAKEKEGRDPADAR